MSTWDKIEANLDKCQELDGSEAGGAAYGLQTYAKYWANESQQKIILKWSEEMLQRLLEECDMVTCEVCKKEFPEVDAIHTRLFILCSEKCLEKHNTFGLLTEGDMFSTKVGKYVKRDGKGFCIDVLNFGTVIKFNKKDPIIRE